MQKNDADGALAEYKAAVALVHDLPKHGGFSELYRVRVNKHIVGCG